MHGRLSLVRRRRSHCFQVWWGTGIGLAICVVVGAGMIGAFYGLGTNAWSGAELIWEGVFAIIACLIISIMGAALLRVSKLQAKWRVKLARALEAKDKKSGNMRNRFKTWCEKYAMFILPFVTIMREGLEAMVFIGGVSLGLKASSIPLAVVCGLVAGSLVGYFVYKYVYSPHSSTVQWVLTKALLQRRHVRAYSNLSYHLHLRPLSCRSRLAVPRSLVPRGSCLECPDRR
jgi:FTR1 family protein